MVSKVVMFLFRYMDVMMSLMADDCRYVMVAQYETSEGKFILFDIPYDMCSVASSDVHIMWR